MDTYVNDAGTLRRVARLFTNDGGTLREIRQAFVNDAGTLRKIFAGALTMLCDHDSAVESSRGYSNGALASAYGSLTPSTFQSSDLYTVHAIYRAAAFPNDLLIGFQRASSTPPDADTTWKSVDIIGVFTDSGGATVTKTYARASGSTSTVGANFCRNWSFSGAPQFILGNTYTVVFSL